MTIGETQTQSDAQHLQIWNNAAFDSPATKFTSSPIRLISIDMDPIKENRNPGRSAAAPTDAKKSARVVFKEQEVEIGNGDDDDVDGDGDTDDEIARIREEIGRLSLRLDRLQNRREERELGTQGRKAALSKRGKVVSAQFLDVNFSKVEDLKIDKRLGNRGMSLGPLEIFATPARVSEIKRSSTSKKVGDSPAVSSGVRRRGMSLGPLEIIATPVKVQESKRSSASKKAESISSVGSAVRRRGVSLGPLDIHGQIGLGRVGERKGSTFTTVQSCKKNSFKKLGGIAEEEISSPKSRSALAVKSRSVLRPQENTKTLSNVRTQMRGLSLGPSEIVRRDIGISLTSKLQESKQKGAQKGSRSMSVSPKPQLSSAAQALELRKGINTVGAQKLGSRGDKAMANLKPKALFQDGIKAVTGKKQLKSCRARIVPSRYSLAPSRVSGDEPGRKQRKLSLPEIDNEKKKKVLIGTSESMPDCEIDEEFEKQNHTIVDYEIPKNFDCETINYSLPHMHSPSSIAKVAHTLPEIKTLRYTIESPRDSGCAKRASQLVGRRSPFSAAEGAELDSASQVLNFQDEDIEE